MYEAGEKNKKKVLKYDSEVASDRDVSAAGNVRSEDDLFLNGAEGEIEGSECVFDPRDYYPEWSVEPANDSLVEKLLANAGWQDVPLPKYFVYTTNMSLRAR